MEEVYFNIGADFWYAHYYDNLAVSFVNQEAAHKFGEFFSNGLNGPEEKKGLCLSISDIINKNYDKLKDTDKIEIDSLCFIDEPIRYIERFQYIKFPDFKDKQFDGLIIRMDINPCVGKENSMTKIYCISRYRGRLTSVEVKNFFAMAEVICKAIVETLSLIYIQKFNEFAEKQHYIGVKKVKEEKLSNPFRLVSRCVGSDDENTTKFLHLLQYPEEWNKFCRKNAYAKTIFATLGDMNEPAGKGWKLADYKWFREKVLYEKKDISPKQVHETWGYIGFKRDDNMGHFIGISSSSPRDILLPIHLDFIRSY
jgi:hypothetical protein